MSASISKLSFEKREITGEIDWATWSWDFIVDGAPLWQRFDERTSQHVSPFGWLEADFTDHYRQWLLLEEPSPIPSGRVPIYICPIDADFDCGALVARITIKDGVVEWSDFGWERETPELDELMKDDEYSHLNLAPVVFDEAEYRVAVNADYLSESAGPTHRGDSSPPPIMRSVFGWFSKTLRSKYRG